MLAYEADTAWNRGIPCNFSKTNPIVFVMFISLFFDLLYQRGYQRQDRLRIKRKSAGLWGSYGLEQGNTLQFFQNTNKKLFFWCTNLFTYCMINGIKVKKCWRWIEKVLAYETDFLARIMKKRRFGIFLIDRIICMYEYVYKCAMVVWNYITQWFSSI